MPRGKAKSKQSDPNSSERNPQQDAARETVPKDIYVELMRKLDAATTELETYRAKSPLVGVRWYGEGGFGTRLAYPIAGVTMLALRGFGDKGVIDYATWTRIKKLEHAEWGLLVRDDDVIEELHVLGAAAQPDEHPTSNCFTPDEAEHFLLKSTTAQFKKRVALFTSHWAAIRLLKAAADLDKTVDPSRIALLNERSEYLQAEFRWSLLHHHELRLAAEGHKIRGWEDMDDEDIIHELTEQEMKMYEEYS